MPLRICLGPDCILSAAFGHDVMLHNVRLGCLRICMSTLGVEASLHAIATVSFSKKECNGRGDLSWHSHNFSVVCAGEGARGRATATVVLKLPSPPTLA